MRNIIVGVDGSPGGEAALRFALVVARATDANVYAVSALTKPFSEVPSSDHDRLLSERFAELTREWIPTIHDVDIRPIVRSGDAREVLPTIAEEHDADLIAIGRVGADASPGFLHLGSVAEHAAHSTLRPLAVIPHTWSGKVERMVVGVDGSDESIAALEWSGTVAEACASNLIAVMIDEPSVAWANWQSHPHRELEKFTAGRASDNVKLTLEVERNVKPADGLLQAVTAHRADALVVGLRGLGGFTGLRAGGVSMKILHRAAVPLIMVPSGHA